MLLLGEKVSGVDAADWGLIQHTVGPDELQATTEGLLAHLASDPTVGLELAKQAIHYGQHSTLSQSMSQERFNLELCCRTGDFKDSLAAFRGPRVPHFAGR